MRNLRLSLRLSLIAALLGSVPLPAAAQLGPGKLVAKRIVTGITRPVFVTSPPGDNDRLFIVEKRFSVGSTGRIKIYDKTTQTLLATSFLEIPGVNTGNEEGLLGLAFHPNYATNGYFYTYFSDNVGGRVSRIVRWTANAPFATSNTANPASFLEILRFTQPQPNHNGGWIGFNPVAVDNAMLTGNPKFYLYVSTGDGGGADDNDGDHTAAIGNGQDITNNLLGKILRLDTGSDGNADDFLPFDNANLPNYAIPPDNPFVGLTGDNEIWSYGLRNPWRCCFDRVTGDLWIGDVGQNTREEIDFQPASDFTAVNPLAANYGWRYREGDIATPTPGGGPVGGVLPNDLPARDGIPAGTFAPGTSGLVEPILDYVRTASGAAEFATDNGGQFRGNSITGGCVYRGSMKWLQGAYIFADYGSARLYAIRYNGATITEKIELGIFFSNLTIEPGGASLPNFASISEGGDGEIYICTQPQNGATDTDGDVFVLTQKPFFRYRSTHFTLAELNDDAISGVNADTDDDNLTTVEEFMFNTDPIMGDAPLAGAALETDLAAIPDPGLFLTMTLEISPEAKEAVTYTGQVSNDLQVFGNLETITLFAPPESTTLKVQDILPAPGPNPRRFLRIEATVPASELTP